MIFALMMDTSTKPREGVQKMRAATGSRLHPLNPILSVLHPTMSAAKPGAISPMSSLPRLQAPPFTAMSRASLADSAAVAQRMFAMFLFPSPVPVSKSEGLFCVEQV